MSIPYDVYSKARSGKNALFSDDFLKGLRTKSERFQNKFFEMIDGICDYFDSEEEKRDFQQYIAESHSFSQPGNMLYSGAKCFGGTLSAEELKEKTSHHPFWLFDSFEAEEAMTQVPHIILCVSAPKNTFTDDDMAYFRKLLACERLSRGCAPVGATTILNNNTEERSTSYFVACIK